MIKEIPSIILSSLALMGLASCISYLDVKPIDMHAIEEGKPVKGQIYSMPVPVIKVETTADGVQVTPMVLPDPLQTYSVRSVNILGTSKLETGLKNGMLSKLTSEGDTSAVAETLIESGAAVADKQLTQQAKERDEREADIKAAAKTYNQEKLNWELADAALKRDPDNESKKEKFEEAKIKVDAAKRSLDNARAGRIDIADGAGLASKEKQEFKSYGPVFYRVMDNGDTVKLKSIDIKVDGDIPKSQPGFKKYKLPTSAIYQAAEYQLEATDPIIRLSKQPANSLQVKLESKVELSEISLEELVATTGLPTEEYIGRIHQVGLSKKLYVLSISPSLPVGSYVAEIHVKAENMKKPSDEIAVTFEVVE